jgi:PAS domain S-box-containing protein
MLAAGHRLPMGRGVVGTAADTGQSILAADVTKDEDWRPNPHLPETKGELAVPIKLRDEVLGILDVQSDRVGALTDDDRLLLEGLCGQIASAMESTRLLEQLRRNEAQLTEALKIAKLGYWEYDVEKDLFLFNDQFYSIFHTTVEQAGGYQLSSAQYAQQFVHPDDLPLVGTEIEKALNSTDRHYNRQLEHRILYADGGIGYISVSVNIDRDEQGRILRYYGANQDITERKRAEQELERSARLLRTIIDTSRDLIYIKDTESRFLVASQAVARLLGAPTADDLIGKNDYDFFPYELAHKYYTDEQKIIQAGKPLIDIEEPSVYPDGRQIWLSTTKIPYRSPDGKLEGILGIGRDITERKRTEQRMEETLHETERLYAAVGHESWQAYRQTGNLGEGYLFDQALIRPADKVWEPEIAQALEQQSLVTAQSEQRAVAVTPLSVRGEAIGALGVYDDPAHPLSKEDLNLIEAVSEQVALALESARLFDQNQRDAERERTINRVTSRIRNARSVDEVLTIAAQELRLATQASRSIVEILPVTDQPVQTGNGRAD